MTKDKASKIIPKLYEKVVGRSSSLLPKVILVTHEQLKVYKIELDEVGHPSANTDFNFNNIPVIGTDIVEDITLLD